MMETCVVKECEEHIHDPVITQLGETQYLVECRTCGLEWYEEYDTTATAPTNEEESPEVRQLREELRCARNENHVLRSQIAELRCRLDEYESKGKKPSVWKRLFGGKQ